jgi:hypothetical protein
VARLMPSEIQKLLAEAAESLAEPRDREVMDRLIASLPATDIMEWDRKLIGVLLAKAGRLDDCTKVISEMPLAWERADATREVGSVLIQMDKEEDGLKLLTSAADQAVSAQAEGSDFDQQCASAVLADISEIYATRADYTESEKTIESISHPIRQQRALDRMKELRGDPAPEPEEL